MERWCLKEGESGWAEASSKALEFEGQVGEVMVESFLVVE